jgi:acetyltransferase-like isoleucine patch superfamily enzyme
MAWYWRCDRLGPDIPLTHIFLYYPKLGSWICKKKFKYFGDNAEFRPYAYAHYCSKISIGENVIIHPGTILSADPQINGNIVIEQDVSIGSNVHLYAVNHRYDRTDIPIKYQGYYPAEEIRICTGAWIGANVTIIAGVTVGQNSVVGGGAVVSKDVDPFTVVAGNPAKIIKRLR